MYDVKITAMRRSEYPDLMALYENEMDSACSIKVGDTFVSRDGCMPKGLCESAWESMRPFVEALSRGEGAFFDGWMRNRYSAMISCNDGFRPVSFLLERIDTP